MRRRVRLAAALVVFAGLGLAARAAVAAPLHDAVRDGDVERVRQLVADGHDIDGTDERGLTPLLTASLVGRTDVADALLDLEADPDRGSAVVGTLVAAAIERAGGVDAVGGRPTATARESAATARVEVSPLVVASALGQTALVRRLIDDGADLDFRTGAGATPLLLAAMQGHAEAVRALVEAGAEINAADRRGTTPLAAALQRSRAEVVALLRARGGVAVVGATEDDGLVGAAVPTIGYDARLAPPVAGRVLPLGLAVGAGSVYWSEFANDRILSVPADGLADAAAREVARVDGPIGLALDGDTLLFAADGSYPRRIGRVGAGGEVVDVVVGEIVNRPRAVLATGGSVYWTETIAGRIRRAASSGAELTDLYTSGISSVSDRADAVAFSALGLAVDPRGAGRLYWSDAVGGRIMTAAMDGSSVVALALPGDAVRVPLGLAFDAAAGKLYWADAGERAIRRSDADGSGVEDVVTAADGLVFPYAVALGGDGRLYWSDVALDRIGAVAVDRSGVQAAAAVVRELARAPRDGPSLDGEAAGASACASSAGGRAQRFVRSAGARLEVCLLVVDALKAVKRGADDARRAAGVCRDQLAALGSEVAAAAAALDGCDEQSLLALTAARVVVTQPRTAEWLAEVRPFVAELAAHAALDVVDAITLEAYARVERARAGAERGDGAAPRSSFPASGQTTTYAAITRGRASGAQAVPDDGAVRAGEPMRYEDNGDGTLTDAVTGLMWEKKCDGCAGAHDASARYAWEAARAEQRIDEWLADVNADGGFAGHDDWRLPTARELVSILDYERFNPAVAEAFDAARCGLGCEDLADRACSCTAMSYYWSSTPFVERDGHGVVVAFHLGLVSEAARTRHAHVRAVRGSAASGCVAPEASP